MQATPDTTAASWITDRLHPFATDVGSVIPSGFEAYARILHPAYKRAPDGTPTRVLWRTIAAANGRDLQAEFRQMDSTCTPTEFSSSDEPLYDDAPMFGSLSLELTQRLQSILLRHTQSPDSCYFAVWEGYNGVRVPTGACTFLLSGRSMYLLHGAVAAVKESLRSHTRSSPIPARFQSPTLWWPSDRSWCVATDIDFTWTYVGGSADCVREVLADPEIESLPTTIDEGNVMEK